MKNIFVALALFFALGASAQVKKTVSNTAPAKEMSANEIAHEAALQDFAALSTIVKVTNEATKANVIKTLETKHREMKNVAGLSQERKDAVTNFVTSRLEELLGTEDFAKLKGNAKLFTKLTK
ncbi:hypothetical protein [Flavobacterium soli]|uniref:hypothetical protein n=1 Tax=Flavobacterium soli TaxID=344881 RepID=UPI00040C02A2|nr:hypothetical protein [Flavobacterium soli]